MSSDHSLVTLCSAVLTAFVIGRSVTMSDHRVGELPRGILSAARQTTISFYILSLYERSLKNIPISTGSRQLTALLFRAPLGYVDLACGPWGIRFQHYISKASILSFLFYYLMLLCTLIYKQITYVII